MIAALAASLRWSRKSKGELIAEIGRLRRAVGTHRLLCDLYADRICELKAENDRLKSTRALFELSGEELPALLKPQCGPLHD